MRKEAAPPLPALPTSPPHFAPFFAFTSRAISVKRFLTLLSFPMSRVNEALAHLEAGKARYRIVLENDLG